MSLEEVQQKTHHSPEAGDYIINWHLTYISQIMNQGESFLRNLNDQIKGELVKIKSDTDFIRQKLNGPHENIVKLKYADRDLRRQIDLINELAENLHLVSRRSAERMA